LAKTIPVIWDAPAADIANWQPVSSVTATCSRTTTPTAVPTIGPSEVPSAFTRIQPTSDTLIFPAANGWWLTVDRLSGNSNWRYQWMSPSGAAGPTWDDTFLPFWALPEPDGSIVILAEDPGTQGDPFQVIRVDQAGAITRTEYMPQGNSPFWMTPTLGTDGWLYVPGFVLPTGNVLLRLDPVTLDESARFPDPAGLWSPVVALPDSLVFGVATGTAVSQVKYSDLTPGMAVPPADPLPLLSGGGTFRGSLGAGGDASSLLAPEPQTCEATQFAHRNLDGTTWQSDGATLGLSNCKPVDIDVLPDGRTVLTVHTYSNEIQQVWIDRSGAVVGQPVTLGTGWNATSAVDARGSVVTAFTVPTGCPKDVPVYFTCSVVSVQVVHEASVTSSQTIAGRDQLITQGEAFIGSPRLVIGAGQVAVAVAETPPHYCTGDGGCYPSGSQTEYRTVVMDVALPPRSPWHPLY
jgi:hypothetical protein